MRDRDMIGSAGSLFEAAGRAMIVALTEGRTTGIGPSDPDSEPTAGFFPDGRVAINPSVSRDEQEEILAGASLALLVVEHEGDRDAVREAIEADDLPVAIPVPGALPSEPPETAPFN